MKKKHFLILGLTSLVVSGTIVGVTIYKNINFNRRDLLLRFAFFDAMKKIDPDFIAKYGDEMGDVIDKTINLYQQSYKDEMRKELDLIIKKSDVAKIAEFWKIIRPFYMFVWEHKENVGGKYKQNKLLYDELCKFASKVEPLAFKMNKQWYERYTNGFLTLYNEDQQKELYEIVKKINEYDPNSMKGFYNNAKSLFMLWSSALCYYIEYYSTKNI